MVGIAVAFGVNNFGRPMTAALDYVDLVVTSVTTGSKADLLIKTDLDRCRSHRETGQGAV